MRRVLIMGCLALFPKLLVAQDVDIRSLAGDEWYGVYFNGQKVGFAQRSLVVEEDGSVRVAEEAQFRIAMGGMRQDIRSVERRGYGPDGALVMVDATMHDVSGTSRFEAHAAGDRLILTTSVGGAVTEKALPGTADTVQGLLGQLRLIAEGGTDGGEFRYTVFEPMLGKDTEAITRIVGEEERVLNGVATKVYRIETQRPALGLTTLSYVTRDGTTLEDIIAGMLTMRLEPEAMAKDVHYSNDVIISNAARVSAPIEGARTRPSLTLRLRGPLTPDHLFNDDRQFLAAEGDTFLFRAARLSSARIESVAAPIDDPEAAEWLRPSLFVQSDHPRLIAKAESILSGATDALDISTILCHWVNTNVRTAYSARMSNALEVLASLEGDCTEHSILFVGLARAAGVPAREVAGLVYVGGPQPGFYFHQWAKVWVGKWVDVDPTFDQPLVDATHIKLSEGDLFKQTQLLPIIGQIRIEVVEETP